jgi:serine/threonine protein kinase/WD40 repeat protein
MSNPHEPQHLGSPLDQSASPLLSHGTGDIAEQATLPPAPANGEPPAPALHDMATVVPRPAGTAEQASDATPDKQCRYFGEYELLAEIARGGMGVVYKARQVKLQRVVALKMILAGQLANAEDVQRFHAEAEAAAKLDHPGIVPIFEIGEHEGQHYFSMGFVEGASLAKKVAAGPLPPREAAELVQTVSEAIEYAHQKGIIHRDLKPGNVLLDSAGQPRVTDFGLAKQMHGDSGLTGTGQILGTPSYMPPEQASGKTEEIGPAADVYALGAILYCLLTGRPPFQAANAMDTLLQVLDQEPVPPRQLNPQVPLDLETIALKCLEKSPQRRYATARQVAEELGRYLKGLPILARPVGSGERMWRWCRRNPTVAGLMAAVAISLVAGTVISAYYEAEASDRATAESIQRQRADDKTAEAVKRKTEAEAALYTASAKALGAMESLAQSYLSELKVLRKPGENDRQRRGIDLLIRAGQLRRDAADLTTTLKDDVDEWRPRTVRFWRDQLPHFREDAGYWLSETSHSRAYTAAFPVVSPVRLRGRPPLQSGLTLSDDGSLLAFGRIEKGDGADEVVERIELLRAEDGQHLGSVVCGPPASDSFQKTEPALAFSPDGTRLLIGGIGGKIQERGVPGGELLEIIDLQDDLPPPDRFRGQIQARWNWSPDRTLLLKAPVLALQTGAKIWEARTGKLLRTFPVNFRVQGFTPEGNIFGRVGSEIHFCNITDEEPIRKLPLPDPFIAGPERGAEDSLEAAISPDGKWMVIWRLIRFYTQWVAPALIRIDSGEIACRLELPASPEESHASTSYLPTLAAFDRASARVAIVTPAQLAIFRVADGQFVLSTDVPRAIPAKAEEYILAQQFASHASGLVFDPNGTRPLATIRPFGPNDALGNVPRDDLVVGWDVALPRIATERRVASGSIFSLAVADDASSMVTGGADCQVTGWDGDGTRRWAAGFPGTGQQHALAPLSMIRKPGTPFVPYGHFYEKVAFDPSGKVLLARLPDRLEIHDAATGEIRKVLEIGKHQVLNFSPGDRYVAIQNLDSSYPALGRVYDATADRWLADLPGAADPINWLSVQFSPDARFVAWLHQFQVRLVSLVDERAVTVPGTLVQFSADGSRLAVGNTGRTGDWLRIIDTADGRQIAEFKGLLGNKFPMESRLRFSHDGKRLALFSSAGKQDDSAALCLWSEGEAQPVVVDSQCGRFLKSRTLKWQFSHDGRRLVVYGFPNNTQATVELWDAEERKLLASQIHTYAASWTTTPFIVAEELGTIALGSYDAGVWRVQLWDLANGTRKAEYQGQLKYSALPHRRFAEMEYVPGRLPNLTSVLDLKSGELSDSPLPELHWIGPDGTWMLIQHDSKDGALPSTEVVDLPARTTRLSLPGQNALFPPGQWICSSDGERFATYDVREPIVGVWNAKTGQSLAKTRLVSRKIRQEGNAWKLFNADGSRLALEIDFRIQLVDIDAGSVAALDRPGHIGTVRSVAISHDGQFAASAGDDQTVCIWNAKSGRFLALLDGFQGRVAEVMFSHDGTRVYARDAAGALSAWSIHRTDRPGPLTVNASFAWEVSARLEDGQVPSASALHPDGSEWMTAYPDGRLRVWMTDTGSPGRVLESAAGTAGLLAMAYVPDASGLILAGSDGRIRRYDLSAGRVVADWPAGQGEIRGITVSSDGQRLATAGNDLRIWGLSAEPELVSALGDGRTHFNTVTFSLNGNWLFAGSDDGAVRSWNIRELEQEIRRMNLE